MRALAPTDGFVALARGLLVLACITAPAIAQDDPSSADGDPPDGSASGDHARAGKEAGATVVVYEHPDTEGMTEEELEKQLWPDLANIEPRYEIEDREGKTLGFSFIARYDRVDELSGRFSQSFAHERSRYPRIRLFETYSTGQDRWFYRLEFEQPFLTEDRLLLGAAIFDETTIFTDFLGRVGDGENTLAALFFREDFRHYHAREGAYVHLEGLLPGGPRLRLGYRDEDHGALASTTSGSVFRPRATFRDNPAADEGRLEAWFASLTYRSGPSRRSGIDHLHRLELETTANDGGDFDFSRWLADLRLSLRLSVDQDLVFRARGGGVIEGTLPAQRAFHLGGIGTLRAREFGAFVGERAYLVNVEYGFSVFRHIQAVLFQDIGAVWDGPRSPADIRPELDAGFALRNRSGRFRINIARDVRARQSPLVATVRLTHPF